MASAAADPQAELVRRLTAAFSAELAVRDPVAAVAWATMPTVAALVGHLGGVHRWVAEVVRTGRPAQEHTAPILTAESMRAWFDRGREELLQVLAAVPADTPCWVIGGRIGTAAFWRRRMVFENAKHLIDLRAAGGGRWEAAPELNAQDYADGIDELLTEFLPRSRPTLLPLSGAVVLHATDSGRAWRIGADWTPREDERPSGADATISAPTGDLALMMWERADPLAADDRFEIRGDHGTAAAFCAASIHPW